MVFHMILKYYLFLKKKNSPSTQTSACNSFTSVVFFFVILSESRRICSFFSSIYIGLKRTLHSSLAFFFHSIVVKKAVHYT